MIRERAKIQAQVDMLKTLRELSFSKLHCDSTHSTEPMCVSLSSNCLEQPRSFFHVSKGCCEAEGNTGSAFGHWEKPYQGGSLAAKESLCTFLGPNFGTWKWQDMARQNSRFWVPSVLDGIIPVAPCGTCKNGFCPTAFLLLAGSPRREGVEGY